MRRPSGENLTAATVPLCSMWLSSCSPDESDQTQTVRSRDPVAILAPSSEMSTAYTDRSELDRILVVLCIPHSHVAAIQSTHDPASVSRDCNAPNTCPRIHWLPNLLSILRSPTSNLVAITAYDVVPIGDERDRPGANPSIDFH